MKHLLFVLFLFTLLGAQPSYAQSNQLMWYTDLIKAHEQSKATHKPIFGFFTGSDWCGWCRKLQAEVFAKPAFIKWARENVILLELDFPRTKQLAPEVQQQNNNLQQAFKVNGFPTVWIFYMTKDDTLNKFNISPLGSLGYPSGAEAGKEEVKFLANANEIMAKGK